MLFILLATWVVLQAPGEESNSKQRILLLYQFYEPPSQDLCVQ